MTIVRILSLYKDMPRYFSATIVYTFAEYVATHKNSSKIHSQQLTISNPVVQLYRILISSLNIISRFVALLQPQNSLVPCGT